MYSQIYPSVSYPGVSPSGFAVRIRSGDDMEQRAGVSISDIDQTGIVYPSTSIYEPAQYEPAQYEHRMTFKRKKSATAKVVTVAGVLVAGVAIASALGYAVVKGTSKLGSCLKSMMPSKGKAVRAAAAPIAGQASGAVAPSVSAPSPTLLKRLALVVPFGRRHKGFAKRASLGDLHGRAPQEGYSEVLDDIKKHVRPTSNLYQFTASNRRLSVSDKLKKKVSSYADHRYLARDEKLHPNLSPRAIFHPTQERIDEMLLNEQVDPRLIAQHQQLAHEAAQHGHKVPSYAVYSAHPSMSERAIHTAHNLEERAVGMLPGHHPTYKYEGKLPSQADEYAFQAEQAQYKAQQPQYQAQTQPHIQTRGQPQQYQGQTWTQPQQQSWQQQVAQLPQQIIPQQISGQQRFTR